MNGAGSAPYLSSEQLTGDPADERSDVYALGWLRHDDDVDRTAAL
jgi:serine/threonine protein kinase